MKQNNHVMIWHFLNVHVLLKTKLEYVFSSNFRIYGVLNFGFKVDPTYHYYYYYYLLYFVYEVFIDVVYEGVLQTKK